MKPDYATARVRFTQRRGMAMRCSCAAAGNRKRRADGRGRGHASPFAHGAGNGKRRCCDPGSVAAITSPPTPSGPHSTSGVSCQADLARGSPFFAVCLWTQEEVTASREKRVQIHGSYKAPGQ